MRKTSVTAYRPECRARCVLSGPCALLLQELLAGRNATSHEGVVDSA